MSELRQDPTSRTWVILAPERGKRPKTTHKGQTAEDLPAHDPKCPFCPGNEAQTPPEVFRIPLTDHDADWEVRVVPNRFAALSPTDNDTSVQEELFFRKRPGFGVHEVIIEGQSHNTPMALMPYSQIEKILITYQERYNLLKRNRRLKFITIFKNHGAASGTSLKHPHSQLVATPIAAPYFHSKYDVAVEYCHDIGRCLYCDLVAEELKRNQRIVAETKHFVVLQPYASRVPWETWIVPKMHCASYGLFPVEHLNEMSLVLKDILYCLFWQLGDPAFNFVIDTSSTMDEYSPCYHWHLRILPRTTMIAGFEIGSGIYINPSLPEDTTTLMKEVANSCPDDVCIFLGK